MGNLDLSSYNVLLDVVDARVELEKALDVFYKIPQIRACIGEEHIEKTPARIVKALLEFYAGCWTDPKELLRTSFTEEKYDEMIYVNDISFVSMCAHHALPFFGKAHFAYLPSGKIVGLSKIPRLVEAYSRRPQVQEKLTVEIVNAFEEVIQPKGCGLVMEGIHLCMAIRGVENESAYSKTAAIRGAFRFPDVKHEFLNGIRKSGGQLWP